MRNITLFSQITKLIPKEMFNALVRKFQADYSVKGINSWTHLIAIKGPRGSGKTTLMLQHNNLFSDLIPLKEGLKRESHLKSHIQFSIFHFVNS